MLYIEPIYLKIKMQEIVTSYNNTYMWHWITKLNVASKFVLIITCALYKCVYSKFLSVTNLFASSYVQSFLSTSHICKLKILLQMCYVVLIFVLVSCLQIPKECDFCTLQGEIKIGVYDAYLYN